MDPLTALRARRPLPRGRGPLQPFGSGEHVWLGDAGAASAAALLRRDGLEAPEALWVGIHRRRGEEAFSYGELVALSGDFYGSAAALWEERPSRIPLYKANDVPRLVELFRAEVSWIEARQAGRGSLQYPSRDIELWWNAKAYVELALKNVDHFGWHNAVAYCRHHASALRLAKAAGGKPGPGWERALVHNAFADHFLTDGFAAGHVRVPRREIIAWTRRRRGSEQLAGVLSKVLHDQDGHLDTVHGQNEDARAAEDGLPVRNAAGERWFTRCDGQLFLFPGSQRSRAVRAPVDAVAESLRELVTAWRTGELPSGVYRATRLLPFPDPAGPSLAEKFSPASERAGGKARVDALFDAAPWYAKLPAVGPGLTREAISALFEALPELMRRFRAGVVQGAARPALRQRLAPEYVAGFEQVG